MAVKKAAPKKATPKKAVKKAAPKKAAKKKAGGLEVLIITKRTNKRKPGGDGGPKSPKIKR